MVKIKTFYFNLLRECTYVLYDETCECVIIDPGCVDENEFKRLENFVNENGLRPVKVLLTHGHFDHIIGVPFVYDAWQVQCYAHNNDVALFPRYCEEGRYVGFNVRLPLPDMNSVSEGENIIFGNSVIKVIETPGHSHGGVCYYVEDSKVLFSGDTLFQGSIGRTDLYMGDFHQLMHNINSKLLTLPEDVQVFPGHGYSTTIGEEKQSNPFL